MKISPKHTHTQMGNQSIIHELQFIELRPHVLRSVLGIGPFGFGYIDYREIVSMVEFWFRFGLVTLVMDEFG